MKIETRLVKNFTKGRKGHKVDAIVTHIMEGSMVGTLSWFNNPNAKASSHYGISRKGEIVKYVEEEDTAWHAGRVNRPTHPLVIARGGVSPNLYTVGIEHEGFAKEVPTDAMITASVWLINDILKRHNLQPSRNTIINHREIAADKTCPGMMDADLILSRLGGFGPSVGDRVWSDFFGEHLIVAYFKSDSDWGFIRESQAKNFATKATSLFSRMPAGR